MNEKYPPEITLILQNWNNNDEAAKQHLLPFVYDELKRQARYLMSRKRPNHILQPTALVHEAFMKLRIGDRLEKPQSFLRVCVPNNAADFC